MCTSGIFKMENSGYEDTSYESEQRQAHSGQDTSGKWYPDDKGPLMAQDIRAL